MKRRQQRDSLESPERKKDSIKPYCWMTSWRHIPSKFLPIRHNPPPLVLPLEPLVIVSPEFHHALLGNTSPCLLGERRSEKGDWDWSCGRRKITLKSSFSLESYICVTFRSMFVYRKRNYVAYISNLIKLLVLQLF